MAIDASGEGFVSEDQLKASFDRLNVTMNTEQHRELTKVLKTGDDNLEYGKLLSLMQANESKGEAKGEEKVFDKREIDIDVNASNGKQDRGDSEHPYLISLNMEIRSDRSSTPCLLSTLVAVY